MRRPDRRRELAGLDRDDVAGALANAVELFDRLVAMPQLRDRTITIDTGGASEATIASAAARVLALGDADDAAAAANIAERAGT